MPLLSDIEFGALAVYSPRDSAPAALFSRNVCVAVKRDGYLTVGGQSVRVFPRLVTRLGEKIEGTGLQAFFAGQPILVPAPRSSLIKADSLYPAKVICDELRRQGFGSEVRVLLERTKAVRKAATAPAGERPTVQEHFDSLRVSPELARPVSILVVDDVITSGTMLLAAVSRVKEVFPLAQVRAFALIRTMSQGPIEQIYELCTGTIARRGERCARVP
jgi:hypothetical protein